MTPHDDPRFTAYALGETADTPEADEVSRALAADPSARAQVDATRGVADRLAAALRSEESAGLGAARRSEVERAAMERPAVRSRRGLVVGTAWAATVLLAVGLGAQLQTSRRAGSAAHEPVVREFSATAFDLDTLQNRRDRGPIGSRTGPGRGGAAHPTAPVEGRPQTYTVFSDNGQAGFGSPDYSRPPGQAGTSLYLAHSSYTAPESPGGADEFDVVGEVGFVRVLAEPLSTFSIDVDTASYSIVRRHLRSGTLPPPGAVRVEEMVNYFAYDYAPPDGDEPFAVHLEAAECPWNLKHRLVRVALKGKVIPPRARPASNLVFLVDVSGSMAPEDRLPLVQKALRLLVEELRPQDRVSMVVYAGASGLVLPPTPGSEKATILAAIDRLQSGGSTNGGAGLELAYAQAKEAFVRDGVNRVILATDGDWNVGVTDQESLVRMIEEKAKTGVYLTVLGFGMGNLKDSTLERLADKGNGNYGYVDSLAEAKRLLVEQAGGTLVTIAKDVKIQVEWNPARVAAYRLVGYENRRLAAQDFTDDKKDAGEIGAGHSVTAFYEVVPPGVETDAGSVEPLKYQPARAASDVSAANAETCTVKLRWKRPDEDASRPLEAALVDEGRSYAAASKEFKFASAVASFGLLLRGSPFRGTATYDGVLELAGEGVGQDPDGYRRELLDLVKTAKSLSEAKR